MKDQDYLWDLGEEDFWHTNKDRVLIKLLKGKEVLDVAAGTGSFSIKMADNGFNVTYIDFHKKYVDIAKKRAGKRKIKFICQDFLKYKPTKKFDTIVISGFIEHVYDDVGLLVKINSLLKKGGRVVLLTAAYPWLYSEFDKNVGHYRRYTKKELKQKLILTGFNTTFLKYWDVLGFPVLLLTRIIGKVAVTSENLKNPILDSFLDWWFRFFENKMLIPFGLDLIAVGEKV